jgi:hypothetical protein
MRNLIHSRKKRLQAKRQDLARSATAIIEAIADQSIDAYEGWQQVSGIFQADAGLDLPDLKEFTQLEGIDPNSTISVSEELRETIRRKAVFFVSPR